MSSYRVFVSYSRHDRELAERIFAHLKQIGMVPFWDKDLPPGAPFDDEITMRISHAHVFLPLVTDRYQSPEKPWVHHELAFAMAKNVPILPLGFGQLLEGLPSKLHATTVRADLSDLDQHITPALLEGLVLRAQEKTNATYQCAEWPERRAEMLVDYASRVSKFGEFGRVRHIAAFSAFSIPNNHLDDPVWKAFEGDSPNTPHFRQLLLKERQILEHHAREAGCDLIIKPSVQPKATGPHGKATRLRILRESLESMPDEGLRVVIEPNEIPKNVVIVGDWFAAESVTPRSGVGLLNTIFTRHAPTVLTSIQRFDQQFRNLLRDSRVEGHESRRWVISRLSKMIDDMES